MIWPNGQWMGLLVLAVALLPSPARAQTSAAQSFDDLRRILKTGQKVLVVDTNGRRTKGTVADISTSALVLFTPQRRIFAEDAVTEVRALDPLWNGALIGAAVGAGLALWDYRIDPSEPDNARISLAAITAGAAIGAGIDALVKGGKAVYVSPRRTAVIAVSPHLGTDRQGVMVSVRF